MQDVAPTESHYCISNPDIGEGELQSITQRIERKLGERDPDEMPTASWETPDRSSSIEKENPRLDKELVNNGQ